ncbi:GAF and ANTAR domain-containing protein [Actinoallomurus bryophytorum]|uniref:GAF domain-containing protein n=1 Tax=Actinoallomurus bryophytorum TaxID=1490222 RepID=A0A543CHY9_9ACTN|nr:GAF and ANTAR domain-containing protein [Actinoallomurus bryophytorum]TQL96719.1 GAF domain-containing protein [Actinoallomurus bryophytorum]
MPGQDFEELAVALAEMARDLLAQETLQSTLDRISEHAVELVDGCEAAGILTVRRRASGRGGYRHTVRTLACTDDLVEASDQLQEEVGEGPCFDATRDRREVLRIADMSDQAERWPLFTPRARELGIGSMIGFMLFTSEQNLGSLNMYSRSPGALTERSEQVGWLLASHAAVAFASARSGEDLHASIASRTDIGQATGIVMERHKVAEDQAFAMLSKASQDNNIKLRELARHVIDTGEISALRV